MLTRQAVFPGALGSGGAPPRRQRAAPAAGAELHTSGIFHGVELGVARAVKYFDDEPFGGTVTSLCAPYFRVTYDDGDVEDYVGHELMAILVPGPDDFYRPELWVYDYKYLRPPDNPYWASAMVEFVHGFGARLPSAWLAGAGVARPTCGATRDFLSQEREKLDGLLDELVNGSRAAKTLDNLRNAALKMLHYFATRGVPLPPSPIEAARYFALLVHTRGNVGSVDTSRQALSFVCSLNGWDNTPYLKGVAAAPLEAARRKFKVQAKKTKGLKIKHVARIMKHFGFERLKRRTDHQWEMAFGTAVAIGFKLLLRFDDLSHCRWDDAYCTVFTTHVRFFLSRRKNHQYRGNFLDIARPEDPEVRGVYHLCVEAQALFKSGYVLPRIESSGLIKKDKRMSYASFVLFLRHALAVTGMPEAKAAKYAGHSMRAGGATSAAIHGLSPAEICHLAGVKDINWLTWYNRHYLASRIRASRSIGL